jgi:hypothetical protein
MAHKPHHMAAAGATPWVAEVVAGAKFRCLRRVKLRAGLEHDTARAGVLQPGTVCALHGS